MPDLDPEASDRSRPQISVIVPVRDDPAGISRLLDCLERQTIPRERFEILIGDDGSAVGSLDWVTTGDHVRVLRGQPHTSYAARNRAASAARGSILAFCDSDCLPEPSWLEEGVAMLRDADLAAGEVIFAEARSSVWSLLTADMFLDQGRNVRLARAVTANLFVVRRVFDSAEGFDDSLPSGGDYDFTTRCLALGARLVHAPRAIVRHPTHPDARAFLRKVWWTNRWAGVRAARDGGPTRLAAVEFVPLVGAVMARRRALRPAARLQRDRLAASGLAWTGREELLAITLLYLVVAPVAVAGRIQGLLEGRHA